METIRFIVANLPVIWQRAVEHLLLVGAAVSIAIVTGVTIGILITQDKRVADRVLYAAAVIMTIPSIALFGLLIPILSLIGQGIGYLPALIALILYSQLPIIRNTYTAIMNVDPALREAARGMGMTGRELVRGVEVPIALPLIMAGLRTATVNVVATATLAALTAWGGLGRYIIDGFGQRDNAQIVAGALLVGALALVTELGLARLQRLVVSEGLRPEPVRLGQQPAATAA